MSYMVEEHGLLLKRYLDAKKMQVSRTDDTDVLAFQTDVMVSQAHVNRPQTRSSSQARQLRSAKKWCENGPSALGAQRC